jgi:anti-anti-sigma regulatory factor
MTFVVILQGSTAQADLRAFRHRVCSLLERSDAGPLICDLRAIAHPDARTVESLAGLRWEARRHGCAVYLRNANNEVRDLLALVGLAGLFPSIDALRLEALGEAEHGEQPCRIEEEADPRDPIA